MLLRQCKAAVHHLIRLRMRMKPPWLKWMQIHLQCISVNIELVVYTYQNQLNSVSVQLKNCFAWSLCAAPLFFLVKAVCYASWLTCSTEVLSVVVNSHLSVLGKCVTSQILSTYKIRVVINSFKKVFQFQHTFLPVGNGSISRKCRCEFM